MQYSEARGTCGWPPSNLNSDEKNVNRGGISKTEHEPPRRGSASISVFVEKSGDNASEPSMGGRHNVYSDAARVCISVCGNRQ